MEKYDYIICGGGASGLLLSNAFIKDEFFNDKKILIIERENKTLNDKTFGFWNDKESVLDDMVFKEWEFAEFKDSSSYNTFLLKPYKKPAAYKSPAPVVSIDLSGGYATTSSV